MRLAHMDVHEGLTDRWDSISGGWGGTTQTNGDGRRGGRRKKSMGGGEPGL